MNLNYKIFDMNPKFSNQFFLTLVYLQLNKKKAKAEVKKCHAKTMWSQ